MSENKIGLKPIGDLLGLNFFIPTYQRGYRWTEQQAKDLLDDIYSFAIKKGKNNEEFYCLQPVVVKKCTEKTKLEYELHSVLDNNKWYEVVDGQQRFTTIHILISYLVKNLYAGTQTLYERHGKNLFTIEYARRSDSKEFLDNIAEDDAITKNDENIDYHFMYTAYKTIQEWFSEKGKIEGGLHGVQEKIGDTLIYNMKNKKDSTGIVQVIWYEMEDETNPIDTFIRINMGKIPLTNSELIKALFLQKRNFGSNDIAELRQIEIANEWDRMEYALQDDNFWWFLNKGKNDVSARIDFLFTIMCDVAKKADGTLEKRIGSDTHATFRFFNEKFQAIDFEKLKDEWKEIKDYFNTFEEWFNDPILYHYIGFLIHSDKKLIDIYDLYKERTLKKDAFETKIKNEIKKRLNCKWSKEKGEDGANYIFELNYGNDDPKITYIQVESATLLTSSKNA